MITVYIREIDETEGYMLGEFKPGELQSLVKLFQTYPTRTLDDEGEFTVECKFLSAQFVNGPEGANFEVVVASES